MTDIARVTEAFALARRIGMTNALLYQEATGESFSTPEAAFKHYLGQGRSASQALFPFFDTDHYNAQLRSMPPDTTTYFEHYVIDGAPHGLTPTPLFDLDYISQQIDGAPPENLLDFLSDSRFQAIDPHVMVSKRHYRTIYVDIDNAGVDPFAHFLIHGWREKRGTHPFFRRIEYGRFDFPEICDVSEFNRRFLAACREPILAQRQPMFDVSHYTEELGAERGIANPMQHFLTVGWRDGVSPFPLFDMGFYQTQNSEAPAGRNPYIEYLSDLSHRFAPSQSFDPKYYLQIVPEATAFRGSLLEHFVHFGAAEGVQPHRSITILRTFPSQRSGLATITSLRDAAGREMWFCRARKDEWLAAQLDDVGDIEPSLSRAVLSHCELNSYTGPINKPSKTLIELMVRTARCNCIVVSDSGLEEWLANQVANSAVPLVSHARPWLTLLSASSPTLQYGHAQRGAGATFDVALPGDAADRAHIFAQVLITSLPERLVVRTDNMGVALLRRCGTALLTAIPEVTLLCDAVDLAPYDHRWLNEFIAAHYAEFAAVLYRGDQLTAIGVPPTLNDLEPPRIVKL